MRSRFPRDPILATAIFRAERALQRLESAPRSVPLPELAPIASAMSTQTIAASSRLARWPDASDEQRALARKAFLATIDLLSFIQRFEPAHAVIDALCELVFAYRPYVSRDDAAELYVRLGGLSREAARAYVRSLDAEATPAPRRRPALRAATVDAVAPARR